MITVKPCPFCGYEDVEIDEVGVGEFAVDCPECRAIGPICDTVMEAISFWNDRRNHETQDIYEACAQVCEERHANGNFKYDTRDECAAAIRLRFNAQLTGAARRGLKE
jgi:Lar family restriction alleviation protein